MGLPRLEQPFVVGRLDTEIGPVPVVSPRLVAADYWGTCKVRLDFGRMDYQVDPGLYAVGAPSASSPVLATANYKLSFDSLRCHLTGRDVWLLVLDTNGVNVWCAAGKGTFGTEELVGRLRNSGLGKLVKHRQVILPQLAGPGVAALQVPKETGFTVRYGPVSASDLPAYLDHGCRATPAMRVKKFPLADRLLLAPLEALLALKGALPFFVALALAAGLVVGGDFWRGVISQAQAGLWPYLAGVAAGALLTPLALPWLPGRAFAVKGGVAGLLVAAMLWLFLPPLSPLQQSGFVFLATAQASYWGMKFTGASTYTSLSGVKKEMRFAVPVQAALGLIGLGCWFAAIW